MKLKDRRNGRKRSLLMINKKNREIIMNGFGLFGWLVLSSLYLSFAYFIIHDAVSENTQNLAIFFHIIYCIFLLLPI